MAGSRSPPPRCRNRRRECPMNKEFVSAQPQEAIKRRRFGLWLIPVVVLVLLGYVGPRADAASGEPGQSRRLDQGAGHSLRVDHPAASGFQAGNPGAARQYRRLVRGVDPRAGRRLCQKLEQGHRRPRQERRRSGGNRHAGAGRTRRPGARGARPDAGGAVHGQGDGGALGRLAQFFRRLEAIGRREIER